MFLKKSFKKDLLLLLAKGLDFWDSEMSYSAQRYFLYFGRWRKSTIYSQIYQLVKVGDLEKIVKNGQVYLRLTSQADQKFKQDIPLLALSQKPWDKKWRLVAFDIPEKEKVKRELLRYKLLSLGFGKWQRSVYISPYDLAQEINQYLKHRKLFEYCACLEAKGLDKGDNRALAQKAWQLDRLEKKYQKFIDYAQELEDKIKTHSFDKQYLTLFTEQFLELLREYPLLPQELLPFDWPFREAQKSFKKIISLAKNLF